MLKSHFIEDIFIEFFDFFQSNSIPLVSLDKSPAANFYNLILSGKALTENQGLFMLKILEKHKNLASLNGFEYIPYLKTPQWKKPFRIIDLSKKLFAEVDDSGEVWVLVKFPYQLKDEFDKEVATTTGKGVWDPDRALRKVSVYNANLVGIYDFARKHNFEIDHTFVNLIGEIEEIWQSEEKIVPSSIITNNQVTLVNSTDTALEYFNNNKTENTIHDLLLAKSMGYFYSGVANDVPSKISSSDKNAFWLKESKHLFELIENITGKVCVILDRSGDSEEWVKQFILDAAVYGFDQKLIRVCFRNNKHEDKGFNQWISENKLGGKVEGGKVLIFQSKPAKWLFKEIDDVKLLIVNNLYPSMIPTTKEWIESHPCVIMYGDIKPTERGKNTIVHL